MTTITTPPPPIARDRWGRPLVVPPEGGKAVAYTRCTTFIDCIEDKYNLQKWMQRMVATGLASRPDLLLSVSAHLDDKGALDKICESAREAAQATAAATTGTALHALTELIDRGQELPPGLPANVQASLKAYEAATADLKATHIEQFCVLDMLKSGPPGSRMPGIGGTPDRIVKYQGGVYIADLKTGSIQWGALKIAMQLALYSRSQTYDIVTAERGRHNASTTKGIVIHLPAVEDPADARCDLFWVDLSEGWNAVLVARAIREKRKLKLPDLMTPLGEPTLTEQLVASLPATDITPAPDPSFGAANSLTARILACSSADEVRALWTADWTDDMVALAKAHVVTLAS
jgi:hypothetical protein